LSRENIGNGGEGEGEMKDVVVVVVQNPASDIVPVL